LSRAIGDKSAEKLAAAFAMETVEDLLRHYPRRYADAGALTPLGDIVVGEHITVMAKVVSAANYSFGPGGRKVRTEVVVTDETGRLSLTFFNQGWRVNSLTPGTVGLFSGVVGEFNGRRQLTHPAFDAVGDRLSRDVIAIYPATAQVSSWDLEKAVGTVLDIVETPADPIPDEVRARHGYQSIGAAFESVHRPQDAAEGMRAKARFRFEEALVIQTVFAQRRRTIVAGAAVARAPRSGGLRERFEARLPFDLTAGQHAVLREIDADLGSSHPMHRLLQGEVGSGKTLVALLAMLQVVDAGGQAALLAPTELLAAQHQRSITELLGNLAASARGVSGLQGVLGDADGATRVRLLTGSMGAKARKETLLDAASGAAGIVIGTHALLQQTVQFAELGLLVIDEQHRFGVEQRALLADRPGKRPHVLVMTATPIPRTLAMTVFGDLEISTLSELPAGRRPIQTAVVPARERPDWLERAWARAREEVGRGRQAYVVVSRIGDENSLESEQRALVDVYAELSNGPLEGLRMGMLHGRLDAEQKDATMRAFVAGDIDVLVATTVVEVGVDVPNATVMVILDADRFGASQLHQLRGRVGRGTEPGLCLLVTEVDPGSPAAERLRAVASTTDGFELSRLDVELRSEGDVLGSRQSGIRSGLRLLSVIKDAEIIERAREAATDIVDADPMLSGHPALAAAVAALEATEQAEYLERT
jgi:ATP-dependent DNA helicase RecG